MSNKKIMVYQVALRLSNSPYIKARQRDPIQGRGSQKPVKEQERAPVPRASSLTRGPSYIIYM